MRFRVKVFLAWVDGPAQVERREGKMDKIEQCVSDVVAIANGSRDHEQAKARMKELLDDAKFQLGQWFSTEAPRSTPRGL
jgi:hypothetical protein